jgi:hypothetical protein
MPVTDDDDMTELVDADFPRVDLVGKGANGIPRFLIAKQDESSRGLVPADMVRELIGKQAGPETQDRSNEGDGQVTVKGSPAAIAAFIHKASERQAVPAGDVAKAEMSSKAKNDLPDSAFAYIEPGGKKDESGKTTPRSLRHFPLTDENHIRNALSQAPKSPFGEKAMPKIRAAAKAKGIDVAKAMADAGIPEDVIKAMTSAPVAKDALGALNLDGITPDAADLDNGTDGMDPTTPFADPGNLDDLPGDPDDPGSPAWEAIDAATAQKWTSILARAKNALGLLSDREMLEAATVDPDDADNAYDLQDAQCALDFAIGTLAVFAAGEQAETDICTEAMAVSKALAGFDPAALSVVEGLVPVAKAGRVLSAANEGALRTAAESINKVLASLPQAPTADDQVTKEATVAATDTKTDPAATAEAQVAKAEETAPTVASDTAEADARVAKAKADLAETQTEPGTTPPVADRVSKAALPVGIYDAGQALLGIVDPARIVQQVTKADAPADGGDGAKAAMMAVFDQEGNLIGIVDPAEITPVQGASKPKDDGADPAKPADDAKAADPADLTPAPSADAGTPADGSATDDDDTVTKSATIQATEADGASPQDTISKAREVLKPLVAELVGAELDARGTAEGVAKSADIAAALEEIGVLKTRVTTVENSPAMPKVFTNGAVPPPGTLRGQDQGVPLEAVTKAQEMRDKFRNADPVEQNRLAGQMTAAGVSLLAEIHGRPQQ